MLDISFDQSGLYENDTICIIINDSHRIDQAVKDIDTRFSNIITRYLESSKFKGKFCETANLTAVDPDGGVKNIILVGAGTENTLKEHNLTELGGKIISLIQANKSLKAAILVSGPLGVFKEDNIMSFVAYGALLNSYKFDKYFSKSESEEEPEKEESKLEKLAVIGEPAEEAALLFKDKKAIADAVYFARDLVSEAPNVLYPESYAEIIVKELEKVEVDVEVLGEREMLSLGMGALLGVGQGSARESKMVVMKYNGGAKDAKPVALVGKGVTFDTGGISLKPAAKMDAMKYDMGGSASVVGAMKAIAARKAKVNVVGIVGLVENMPGSNAQRPGDVVKTMSGKTVEVLNTDAEGRLVLCDCVTYLQRNFTPDCIIDLATLTGAILVALANTYAGLFSNDDELAQKLISSADKVDEKLWRMPLHKDYDEMLKSPIADVANISHNSHGAGSSTAAHFIQRFIEKDVKWAHLDIAGMAWENKGNNICPRGAVGFGVRLLNQFIVDNYES